MAKIDVTKIEGYADMTPEEKLKALEEYELEEPDLSDYVSKKTFDKTASELAKKKKELADKMTEEEKRALADKENLENMQRELAELRKERQVAENKAKFIGIGFTEEMADETAKALSEGNLEVLFKNQKLHQEEVEKKLKSDFLAGTKKPEGGNPDPDNTMTKNKLKEMSFADRMTWAEKNPTEYAKIYGG